MEEFKETPEWNNQRIEWITNKSVSLLSILLLELRVGNQHQQTCVGNWYGDGSLMCGVNNNTGYGKLSVFEHCDKFDLYFTLHQINLASLLSYA